ncbi:hypothetical protein Q7C_2603 [Methylophaga frappieri]|uniref:Uncharacterized protein n=1 Tax=Methylophaga frappieri (strain ATCC BAA-2434 / DSM 25690 / JAM7) TaxID=754477 RepID=I1YLD1_METFJ|nr:hypothetical protein Q7C_2603 [Methylophaga frappieri]
MIEPQPGEPHHLDQFGTPYPNDVEGLSDIRLMIIHFNSGYELETTFKLIMGGLENRWAILYYDEVRH